MWPKYLPLATFAYNTFNTPNLEKHNPYELIVGNQGPCSILIQILTSRFQEEYYDLPNKRLKYLHDLLLNFKSKRLAMINKDRAYFQYNSRNLVYIISLLTCQFHTASITIKYVGCVVMYKIIDLHNYLLRTSDGRMLKGLFEHERLKPTIIRTSQGNVQNLAQLKQVMTACL